MKENIQLLLGLMMILRYKSEAMLLIKVVYFINFLCVLIIKYWKYRYDLL